MQFSVLPRSPHHCLCTPGVLVPFLAVAVSSTTPTVPRPSPGKAGEGRGDVPLEGVAGQAVGPGVVAEELLPGADGGAGGEGDGLGGLAGQVGEEPAAVDPREVESRDVVAA